jgi:pyridoxine 4-dehydrogenase
MTRVNSVHAAGSVNVGEVTVHRLGFGAMWMTSSGTDGMAVDQDDAVAVLRRAVELGVDLIDTAGVYGSGASEELIFRALHPYPADLLIMTKVGLDQRGAGKTEPNGRPDRLKAAAEDCLRRLGVETLGVLQLHAVDPKVPFDDQVGALAELCREGKARAIGLCDVTVEELVRALGTTTVVSVQSRYNMTDRRHDDVLAACAESGIVFVPCEPLGGGELTKPGGRAIDRPIDQMAWRTGSMTSQLALAWLLRHSPLMAPIPGTASIDHLEENLAAAERPLDDVDYELITSLVMPGIRVH